MKSFRLLRPRTSDEVDMAVRQAPTGVFKSAGIDLLDRMKERVDEPDTLIGLVDVAGLEAIELSEEGTIRIGAKVTLAALAASPLIQRYVPHLAEAAGDAASPQLRARATVGGNLGQHTRCGYYRHKSFPCLKRGGDHCPVRKDGGVQDQAGIFGNDTCASAHPSSVAPALCSMDATLLIRTAEGGALLALANAWQAPAKGRADDLALPAGAWIEFVDIPLFAGKQAYGYAEIRQKEAFDWALVSCAVRVAIEAGVVKEARVWLGSVAPTPHRATAAEAALVGKPLSESNIAKAAEAGVADATPLPGTTYKRQLARVAIKRALAHAGGVK
jgi:xanthine dehydrogenase YagS FAD-binding subunit